MSSSTLIVVAHPKDELLAFSSVARGATIAAATDLPGFEASCEALGAAHVVRLGFTPSLRFRLPAEALTRAIRALGAFERVYTHSPLDRDPLHQDVALAAAAAAETVRVPSWSSPLAEVHVLDAQAFARKLDLLNRVYAPHLGALERCSAPVESVLGVEAFAEARRDEMMRATSLTHFERVLDEAPDTWNFERSPYERERYARSLDLMERTRPRELRRILELGACEGLMTLELTRRFPDAEIVAVEPNARFAARIRDRTGAHPRVTVLEQPLENVDLTADLVVAAEVLYYLPDRVADMIARLQTARLFTSAYGAFDADLSALLLGSGFRELAREHVPIRFEPTDGEQSALLVRRVGATMRVFTSGPVER